MGSEISAAVEGADISPPADSAPSAEASETAPEAADETPAEFSYDSWDGSRDSLPEDYFGHYDAIHGKLDTEMSDLRNELERDQELYTALLSGEDIGADARKELETVRAELEALQQSQETSSDYQTKYEEVAQQLADKQAAEDQAIQTWADNFQRQHTDIFSDTEKASVFTSLLEAGLEPDPAVTLMQFPQEVAQSALRIAAQGVPADFAVRHAVMEHQQTVGTSARPRTSARLTAGASGGRVPETTPKDPANKAISLRDARRIAASRALHKEIG